MLRTVRAATRRNPREPMSSVFGISPWPRYVPNDKRLDQWLKQKKLTPDRYLEYCSEVTLGFARREGDVRAKRKYDAMMKADEYNPVFAPLAPA